MGLSLSDQFETIKGYRLGKFLAKEFKIYMERGHTTDQFLEDLNELERRQYLGKTGLLGKVLGILLTPDFYVGFYRNFKNMEKRNEI